MERIDPRARSDAYGSRLNRSHSPLIANVVPWLSIMLGSLFPIFFIAAALPMIPPLGFLMLLGWRLVRPGLLPVWAGIPLGLFDDLYNGQPFGFAMFTWSVTLLIVEASEMRLPWRAFWQDWLIASLLGALYLFSGWLLSGAPLTSASLAAIVPQLVLTILVFPIISRIVARLDLWRLWRWKRL